MTFSWPCQRKLFFFWANGQITTPKGQVKDDSRTLTLSNWQDGREGLAPGNPKFDLWIHSQWTRRDSGSGGESGKEVQTWTWLAVRGLFKQWGRWGHPGRGLSSGLGLRDQGMWAVRKERLGSSSQLSGRKTRMNMCSQEDMNQWYHVLLRSRTKSGL